MDRGAWWATVRGLANSQTQLSNLAHRHQMTKINVKNVQEFKLPNSQLVIKTIG